METQESEDVVKIKEAINVVTRSQPFYGANYSIQTWR